VVEVLHLLAPNPSPMTLEGTNTWVLVRNGEAVVVDPGPLVDEHLEVIAHTVAVRSLRVRAVVTTHAHPDHAEALWACAERLGCGGFPSAQGARWALERVGATRVDLPGHALDHVGFVLEDRRVLTGDHVLGRGTSAIIYPEGSLEAYFASLALLSELKPAAILPGHGPVVDGSKVAGLLTFLSDHRRARLQELADLLGIRELALSELVGTIYGDLGDPIVAAAAARSTLAGLVWLADHAEGAVALAAAAVLAREGRFHQSLPSSQGPASEFGTSQSSEGS